MRLFVFENFGYLVMLRLGTFEIQARFFLLNNLRDLEHLNFYGYNRWVTESNCEPNSTFWT